MVTVASLRNSLLTGLRATRTVFPDLKRERFATRTITPGDSMTSADERPEYSEAVSHRHASSRGKSGRLRLTYFGVASLWGFLVGVVALLVALQAEGAGNIPSAPMTAGYLIPAAAIAMIGGAVVARAYRDAKRR